ncbi:MAG: lipoprotein [Acidobacteriota bacterium]
MIQDSTSQRRAVALLTLAALLLVSLAACGRKGDPLPPLRYIPIATSDFDVRQQGSELILGLSYPQTTTSGQVLPGLQSLEIYQLETGAGASEVPPQAFQSGAELWVRIEGVELEGAIVGDQIRTRLPVEELLDGDSGGSAFAVRTVSSTEETSAFSNIVQVDLAGALEPPRNVEVDGTAEGVRLAWTYEGESEGFNVYRRLASERTYGAALATAAPDASSYLDATARTGQRYIYAVRTVRSQDPLVESGASAESELDYIDRFPPEAPQRLIGLGESGQIRLVWEASESPDVSSYRVYRRDPTGTDERLVIEGLRSTEFVDEGLTPGLAYSYEVSAVDGAGNESGRSNAAEITVP